MSNVLNRTTKEYLISVSTGFYSTASWIINPDMSAVVGVPSKYWKITGDVVSEMSQAEKDAVDYPNLTGLVVVYDPSDAIVGNRLVLVLPAVLLINFDGVQNVLQNPVLPNNVMFKHMKYKSGSLEEMSDAEKNTVNEYVPIERNRQLIINDIYLNSNDFEQRVRLMSAIDVRTSLVLALDDYNYPLSRDILIDIYNKNPEFLVEDLIHCNKYIPVSILEI